ncbi:hypothetical protein BZA77DRAFT_386707 [Pyronema omphalodes]|nr:hypothetical protein BZA77DRAFT_386707 [Pyronema omphalodes]
MHDSQGKKDFKEVKAPRRYTVDELLQMRHTLRHVCCPLNDFRRDAWNYGIIRIYPAYQKVNPHSEKMYKLSPAYGTDHVDPHGEGSVPTPVQAHRHANTYGTSPRKASHIMPNVHNGSISGLDYHRYATSPMATRVPQAAQPLHLHPIHPTGPAHMAPVPPVMVPAYPVPPMSEEMLRQVADLYPRVAAEIIASYRAPLNHPVAFKGYPLLQSPQRSKHPERADPAAFETPSRSTSAKYADHGYDLSGGYPAVNIGSTGYPRGQSSQGFVPGGTLKTIPVTGLTPTTEKTEPQWKTPVPSLSQSGAFDPNQWIQQTNKSSFDMLQEGNGSSEAGFRGNKPTFMYPDAHAAAAVGRALKPNPAPNDADNLKGKRGELSVVVEEDLPPAPSPMLGPRSNVEQQKAFIAYMNKMTKRKVTSVTKAPAQKENMANSGHDNGTLDGW